VALYLGRGPSVWAAFQSVACFDFFFVPPKYTFSVDDPQYLLTFAIMLAIALNPRSSLPRSCAQLPKLRVQRRVCFL
jgi:K+-sensing histidine kinase KdpD